MLHVHSVVSLNFRDGTESLSGEFVKLRWAKHFLLRAHVLIYIQVEHLHADL